MKTKLTLFVTVFAIGLQSSYSQEKAKIDPFLLKKGLVAYFPFNGNSLDESGNGNHAGVSGASFTEDRNRGKQKAYSFDGKDDYIQINPIPLLSELTISGWALPIHDNNTRGAFHPILGVLANDAKLKTPGRWIGFHYNPVTSKEKSWIRFHPSQSPNQSVSSFILDARSPKIFKFNEWVHVVGTYNGKEAIVYVNGKQAAKRSMSTESYKVKTEQLFIGSDPDGDLDVMSGSIDDVRIYNRALSNEEVKALYDLEKPKGK